MYLINQFTVIQGVCLLAPSYQHEDWCKLRHHVKVANSRRSLGLVYTPGFHESRNQ